MKHVLQFLFIFCLTVNLAHAQCPVEFTLTNVQALDDGGSTVIEFDVFIRSTGADFYLGDFDMAFSFDPAAFSSPVFEQVTGQLTPLIGLPTGFNTVSPSDPNPIFTDILQSAFTGGLDASNIPVNILLGRAIVGYFVGFQSATSSTSLALITGVPSQIGRFRLTNYTGPVGDPSLANLNWQTPGLGIVPTTAGCYDPVTNDGFQDFQPDPILILDITLPIEIMSFEGQHISNEYNLLSWETATEENFSHFDLEFGTDGVSFTSIDRQAGKADFGGSYEYPHTEYRSGNNYYRLKMVDQDGVFTYSDIVVINVNMQGEDTYTLYPNPAKENVTLDWSTSKEVSVNINIYDVAGKLVQVQVYDAFAGLNTIKMNVSALAPGSYSLRLMDQNGSFLFTEKLVVIR